MRKTTYQSGLSLMETVIAIALLAILSALTASGMRYLDDQQKTADYKSSVEKTFAEIDRYIRTELGRAIINPPILRVDWPIPTPDPFAATDPDPRYLFSAELANSFADCNHLLLRSRYIDSSDITTFGITELRTVCADALGFPSSFFSSISSDGACPAATPRPVFVVRHWVNEYDYPDVSQVHFQRFFPNAMPQSATKVERSIASPFAVQVCFNFTPPYDAVGDPDWTATPLNKIRTNIAIAYPDKGETKLQFYRQTIELPPGQIGWQHRTPADTFRFGLRGALDNIRK